MSRPGGVNLPDNFDPNDPQFKKFANRLPTKATCDLNDPREMFLWMLVALPGVNGGHQVMPSSYNMLISERLYTLGAMLVCENCGYTKDPELKYQPSVAEDPHWLTSPGSWIPSSEDVVEPDDLDKNLDALTHMQQSQLYERLKKRHEQGRI